MTTEPVLSGAGVELDRDLRQVSVHGHNVHLTKSEFAILELLMERPRAVSSDTILYVLYGDRDEPESAENIVRVYVHKIRQKLSHAGQPDAVRSLYGGGYLFAGWGAGRRHIAPRAGRGRKPAAHQALQ